MALPSTPEALLKDIFGYTEFRPLQREVIANVLAHRDTLAVLPTGGGKSLCYQIPALIFPGLTVVVSPLIALMKDQVEQLGALGIPALFLNSSLSLDEYRENMDRVARGEIKLLYVAPETLLTPRLAQLLASLPVDCLTIDEAHCISEWGHDFRPEYRQLIEVRRRFPKAVCLALTATATPRVQADIKDSLGFTTDNAFIASFNRPNLLIEVLPKSDPAAQVLEFLEDFPGQSGIIYCFSRKGVDDLTAFLARQGYAVLPYHAGLEDAERRRNQEAFLRDDVQIIVATIAFGMGINKPNVRFVVHYDLPKSIESYYQEIGRAGRDGLPAHCLLLYSYGDVQKLRYFIDQKDEAERAVAMQHLQALTRYAESDVCRRGPLLGYFGEAYETEHCGMCDICLGLNKTPVDITIPAQKFLSCVKRTGERFGAVHVVDVLLGAENQKVLKFGHQRLSTYGVGKELTRKQWLHIGRQLIQKGLLDQDPEYGSLRLSPKAYEVLRTRAEISGYLEQAAPTPEAKGAAGEIEHDRTLFELLRKRRKELADASQVPPYVIFPDRTLMEMAAYFPQTPEALRRMYGVGKVKAERYGPGFLELVQAYCASHPVQPREMPGGRESQAPAERTPLNPRHRQVGEAYNAGTSLQALMDQYGVQRDTILDHLTRYALEGSPLRGGEDLLALSELAPAQQKAALQAFAELGPTYLKPVFERLNGMINYDDLKVLRVVFLAQHQAEAPGDGH